MEVLKWSLEWAKSEVFSARFFIFFALLFLLASLGFRQLGKTEMARSYVVPTLIAGLLILMVGVGIYYANRARITQFAEAYQEDPMAFVASEKVRSEKSIKEYSTIVYKVIPIIIALAALVIVFVEKPVWRASAITVISMMVVILLVDSNANARIVEYRDKLESVKR